jgi:membrane protease YdiL (CAAX protease family)
VPGFIAGQVASTTPGLWTVALYTALVNSGVEEFLFRGAAPVLMGRPVLASPDQPWRPDRQGWLTAALFALYHLPILAPALPWPLVLAAALALAAAGLGLDWVRRAAASLPAAWAVHGAANLGLALPLLLA